IVTDLARQLVQDYRVPLAYAERSDEPERHRVAAYRFVRCPNGKGSERGLGDAYNLSPTPADRNLCTLTTYEPLPANPVVAQTVRERITVDGVSTLRFRILVRRPDGQTASVVYFAPRNEVQHNKLGAEVLASALGLPKRRPGDPAPPGKDLVDTWIEASRQRMTAATGQMVDVLAATGKLPTGSNFVAQRVDPQAISRNAGPLMQQLDRGLGDDQSGVETAVITRTLALLPEADWRREAPGILAIVSRHRPLDADLHGDLMLRLVDLGPAAIPLFARASAAQGLPDTVLVGACKFGAAAQPALGPRVIEAWRRANLPQLKRRPSRSAFTGYRQCVKDGERNGPPEDIAFSPCWRQATLSDRDVRIYLTLKRMGLGAQADAMARHDRAQKFASKYAGVGPNSPATICLPDPAR
ncbi:MAG TPA: hypothetical protein VFV30_08135, partial [Novosphingobium sp.]|nr:hypothetical protein [Novosphingobium sp.]